MPAAWKGTVIVGPDLTGPPANSASATNLSMRHRHEHHQLEQLPSQRLQRFVAANSSRFASQ